MLSFDFVDNHVNHNALALGRPTEIEVPFEGSVNPTLPASVFRARSVSRDPRHVIIHERQLPSRFVQPLLEGDDATLPSASVALGLVLREKLGYLRLVQSN